MPSTRYRRNYRKYGTHEVILDLVPAHSKVLDVGCATGYLGTSLASRGCEVWGLDRDPEVIARVPSSYREAVAMDLEDATHLPWPEESFDVVVAADVLEHLRDPVAALRFLHGYVRQEGFVIISVPNVAHASVRFPLLFGRFRYQESGILDETHYRLFTFRSAEQLVEASGMRIESVYAGSDRLGVFLNRVPLLGRLFRGLFAYGIVIASRRSSNQPSAEKSKNQKPKIYPQGT